MESFKIDKKHLPSNLLRDAELPAIIFPNDSPFARNKEFLKLAFLYDQLSYIYNLVMKYEPLHMWPNYWSIYMLD